jgi:DNA-binding NarL/FixJ family response regulator
MSERILIVDADVQRRAAISFFLHENGVYSEPFEDCREISSVLPMNGIALVQDGPQAVSILMREIVRQHAPLYIVAYSEDPEPQKVAEAVLDGAVGYVNWPNGRDSLVSVLRTVSSRTRQAVSISGPRKQAALERMERLSKREREILNGMVDGLSNRGIGDRLSMSPRTVELHRANLLSKINARSSAEAIRWAIEASLP